MTELRNPQALVDYRQKIWAATDPQQRRIRVCDGTGCRALGSRKVLARLQETLREAGLADEIEVMPTGCPGFCELGPLITIDPEKIAYNRVSVDDVPAIVTKTIAQEEIIDGLVFVDPVTEQTIIHDSDLPFYTKQTRRVLALNGEIDPTRIEDYVSHDGYAALSKALCQMTPASSGITVASHRVMPNTSSATPTKAIPARSWTAVSWKATPTASWKE
jgi:NADH-quinone oxidoreductase subunit F